MFEPSEKRLAEARERGDEAISPVLTGALALLGALIVVEAVAARTWRALGTLLVEKIEPEAALGTLLALAAPLVLVPAGVALLTGLAQTRGLIAVRVRRTGRRGGLVTVSIVLGAIAIAVVPLLPLLPRLAGATPALVVPATAVFLRRVLWAAAGGALLAGVIDLLRARRERWEALRMTRAEVLREQRETQGDPQIKAERARRASEAAPLALIVMGNVSVGLAFAPPDIATPRVVHAPLAAHRRHEDARLAALLAALPDGADIPPALYEEVAALL